MKFEHKSHRHFFCPSELFASVHFIQLAPALACTSFSQLVDQRSQVLKTFQFLSMHVSNVHLSFPVLIKYHRLCLFSPSTLVTSNVSYSFCSSLSATILRLSAKSCSHKYFALIMFQQVVRNDHKKEATQCWPLM